MKVMVPKPGLGTGNLNPGLFDPDRFSSGLTRRFRTRIPEIWNPEMEPGMPGRVDPSRRKPGPVPIPVQNWYQMIDAKFLQCEQLTFFRNFATYAFYITNKFFLEQKLSFDTSDSDFCDLLDELFHMVKKHFLKKSKCQILFQSPKS